MWIWRNAWWKRYLRVVLFSKVHVGGDGFHVPKLLLSYSCICHWFWFPPGCGSKNQQKSWWKPQQKLNCPYIQSNESNRGMYLSFTDVIAEVKKKSGSGFRLSLFQSFSSPSSSHREEKRPGVWSSNLNEALKKCWVSINCPPEPGTEPTPFLEWAKHVTKTDLEVTLPLSSSSPAKRLPFLLL